MLLLFVLLFVHDYTVFALLTSQCLILVVVRNVLVFSIFLCVVVFVCLNQVYILYIYIHIFYILLHFEQCLFLHFYSLAAS